MELSKYEDQATTPAASEDTRVTSTGLTVPSALSAATSAPARAKKRAEVRIEMDTGDGEAAGSAEDVSKDTKASPSRKSGGDSSRSSNEDNYVTSREPPAVSSSSFATPSDTEQSPTKMFPTRRKTFSEKGPVKIADIKLAAADIKDRAHSLWDTAKPRFSKLYEIVWRLLEIHMMKVVFISAITVAVIDVSKRHT